MKNKKALEQIKKENNFDDYKYLGKQDCKEVYYFIHTELERTTDGDLTGFPSLYIENGNEYSRILGNDLIKAMGKFFKK